MSHVVFGCTWTEDKQIWAKARKEKAYTYRLKIAAGKYLYAVHKDEKPSSRKKPLSALLVEQKKVSIQEPGCYVISLNDEPERVVLIKDGQVQPLSDSIATVEDINRFSEIYQLEIKPLAFTLMKNGALRVRVDDEFEGAASSRDGVKASLVNDDEKAERRDRIIIAVASAVIAGNVLIAAYRYFT